MLEEYIPFIGLLIFGNIENLVLSSQGVVAGANILKLSIYSIICVLIWLIVGTVGATVAAQYASFIFVCSELQLALAVHHLGKRLGMDVT